MKKIRYILLIIVLFVLGSVLFSCCQDTKTNSSLSPSSKENSSSELSPFSPIAKRILHETFVLGEKRADVLKQPLGDDYKSWGLGHYSGNSYGFDLWLYKIEPKTQAGFDIVKDKALPFLNLLLEKLKNLGVKNPKITLTINVNGFNAYKSGITNEYVIK